jgi:mannose-6-phosphate isomerase
MSVANSASSSEWTPFRIEPLFANRVWGYTDLRPWYDRVAQGQPIGEVWLTGDDCLIATGPHAGKTLGSLFHQAPDALLGPGVPSPDSPLLIKTLFAREKLSVQVHPDDKLAQKYGQPRGKTECWYALAAEPGAVVACGLKPGVTLAEIESGIRDHTLEDSLNLIPMTAGDMVLVDAGTVHAIWPGSVILETQQNCDLTYRLYDYGRPRELHIVKGLEAVRLHTRAGKIPPQHFPDRTVLLDVEYFRVERIPVQSTRSSASLSGGAAPGLSYLFAAAGAAAISGPGLATVDLPARSIVAVPAASPDFVVEDRGELDLIRMTPRWPGNDRPETS